MMKSLQRSFVCLVFGAVIASVFAAPAAAQTPQTKVVKQKAVEAKGRQAEGGQLRRAMDRADHDV